MFSESNFIYFWKEALLIQRNKFKTISRIQYYYILFGHVIIHQKWSLSTVLAEEKEFDILFCSITPTYLGQFSKPGKDLKSAGHYVFNTPPTCTIWPSFGWISKPKLG